MPPVIACDVNRVPFPRTRCRVRPGLRRNYPSLIACTAHIIHNGLALTAGTRLGGYDILSQIGAGGMGEVYRARDTKLDRDVAIKVLPDLFAHDPGRLARFEREAKAVATLSHPNILSIFDLGTDHGTAYAVTELLEGETLRGGWRLVRFRSVKPSSTRARSPPVSRPRTTRGSSIATSSPRTSSSRPTVGSRSSTSAWQHRSSRRMAV